MQLNRSDINHLHRLLDFVECQALQADTDVSAYIAAAVKALRKRLAARDRDATWEPEFDACVTAQERLATEFVVEIAGRRGVKASPPDAVRLLEMAQSLYEAERDGHQQAALNHHAELFGHL